MAVPEPATATNDELQLALAPVVLAELTVDNLNSARERRAVFGLTGTNSYSGMRRLQDTSDGRLIGVRQSRSLAISFYRDR